MKPQVAPSSTGFTLAELLVVVIILSIAAAMIIPHAANGRDAQATGAARVLAADLEYAQSYAITNQKPVTVTFNTSAESYALSSESQPLIHPISKNSYVAAVGTTGSGVDLTGADFGGSASVTFDELGSPDSAGSVMIQAGARIYRISVAPATGRITIENLAS